MKKFDRNKEDFEPCLGVIYYPFETDDRAFNRLVNAAKHYLANYPDILWTAGRFLDHPGLRTHQIVVNRRLWDELAMKVPDNLAERTIIYGTVDECVDKIAKFMEAGCKHLIFEPYWIEKERMRKTIEITGEKIIKAFK